VSFTQKLSNLKLEELKEELRTWGNEINKLILFQKIDKLLDLPYYKVPGWKELENP